MPCSTLTRTESSSRVRKRVAHDFDAREARLDDPVAYVFLRLDIERAGAAPQDRDERAPVVAQDLEARVSARARAQSRRRSVRCSPYRGLRAERVAPPPTSARASDAGRRSLEPGDHHSSAAATARTAAARGQTTMAGSAEAVIDPAPALEDVRLFEAVVEALAERLPFGCL